MTREQLEKIYRNAAHIYRQSRLPDVRRKAKEICIAIEGYIGQLENRPANTWPD